MLSRKNLSFSYFYHNCNLNTGYSVGPYIVLSRPWCVWICDIEKANRNTMGWMCIEFLLVYLFFKLQHSLESLRENQQRKEIKESEITKQAQLILFRITDFFVRKHLAHIANYEDFVWFTENDLKDEVLSAYLDMTDSNKNTTYLSTNVVTHFLNVISDWMKDEILSVVKQCGFIIVILDESTDKINRSEMSLIVPYYKIIWFKIWENWKF